VEDGLMRERTPTLLIWAAALLLAATAIACGDDDDDGGPGAADTGQPDAVDDTGGGDDTVDEGTDDTGVDDTGGDDTGIDIAPDALDFVPNEIEPNDLVEEATSITLPATIRGVMGEPQLDSDGYLIPDVDFFSFTATAGTVVRVEVTASELSNYVNLFNDTDDDAEQIVRLLDDNTPGLTRQMYLPVDGTYLLAVEDLINVLYMNGQDVEPVGGDTYTYEISVTEESVAVTSSSGLPLTVEDGSLNPTNDVIIYALSPTEAGLFIADVDAVELESGLDPALVLMNGDQTVMLAQNDDQNFSTGLYDSYLVANVAAGDDLNLVLDFYSAGPDSFFDLTAEVADPGIEREPNDDSSTAWPLTIVESGGTAAPVAGTVGEPGAGPIYCFSDDECPDDATCLDDGTCDGVTEDIPDLDFYALGFLAEGDAVEVTVTPEGGSDTEPFVAVGFISAGIFGPQFVSVFFSQADATGAARIEATAVLDSEYFAVVGDVANLAPEDAGEDFVLDAVGGADYGYSVTAFEWDRTVNDISAVPASATYDLSQGGEVDWHSFELGSEQSGVLLITVEAADFVPQLYLFDPTPPESEPLVVGELIDTSRARFIRSAEGGDDFVMAVFNNGEWPEVAGAVSYDMDLALETPTEVLESDQTDDDFPDDEGTAYEVTETLTELLAEIDGTDGDNHDSDVFKFELAAGTVLVAETFSILDEDSPGDAEDADTVIILSSEDALPCVCPAETTCEVDTCIGDSCAGGEPCPEGFYCSFDDVCEAPAESGPIVDDDGAGVGYFSRIDHEVPDDEATATYYLTVEPYCGSSSCSGGLYGLRLLILVPAE
jgi:hypothetical protein